MENAEKEQEHSWTIKGKAILIPDKGEARCEEEWSALKHLTLI